jgi:lipopolysaccharide export system protein LptC
MRWKISHHGHDPRQIDLLAILALLVVIGAAWFYFDRSQPQSTSAFIVPSQSVRW